MFVKWINVRVEQVGRIIKHLTRIHMAISNHKLNTTSYFNKRQTIWCRFRLVNYARLYDDIWIKCHQFNKTSSSKFTSIESKILAKQKIHLLAIPAFTRTLPKIWKVIRGSVQREQPVWSQCDEILILRFYLNSNLTCWDLLEICFWNIRFGAHLFRNSAFEFSPVERCTCRVSCGRPPRFLCTVATTINSI